MKSIIGRKVIYQTDYMDEPAIGYIKRVRFEIFPIVKGSDGKDLKLNSGGTLTSLRAIKEMKFVEDKD